MKNESDDKTKKALIIASTLLFCFVAFTVIVILYKCKNQELQYCFKENEDIIEKLR